MIKYDSVSELRRLAEEKNVNISDIVLADQADSMQESEESVFEKMRKALQVMRDAIKDGMDKNVRSTSGMTGGEAHKIDDYAKSGASLCGEFFTKAIARAFAVSEYNAAMGKIVAAPTAGSCGVLPGTIVTMLEENRCTEKQAVMAMITASGIGMVIANKASIAGASGGCQAECGSAAAMAAAALVEIAGGTPSQAENACAMAIKNLLGLACDPVAGLVEVPCIKRNTGAVAIAFTCAEMALAGVTSKIPVDECIQAMKEIGDAMPTAVKETAVGGLAATPTGIKLKKQIFG